MCVRCCHFVYTSSLAMRKKNCEAHWYRGKGVDLFWGGGDVSPDKPPYGIGPTITKQYTRLEES